MARRIFFGWTSAAPVDIPATAEEIVKGSDTASVLREFPQACAEIVKASDTATGKNAGANRAIGYWEQKRRSRKIFGRWVEYRADREKVVMTASFADVVMTSDLAYAGVWVDLTSDGAKLSDTVTTSWGDWNATASDGVKVSEWPTKGEAWYSHTYNYIRGVIYWREFAFLKREPYIYTESFYDAATVADSGAVEKSKDGVSSDIVQASDSSTRTNDLSPLASEIVKASDSSSRVKYIPPVLTDAVFATDALTLQEPRTDCDEGVSTFDEAGIENVGADLSAYTVDEVRVIDTCNVLMVLADTFDDIIDVSDVAERVRVITALAYEGIRLTDAAENALYRILTLSDGIKVSDEGITAWFQTCITVDGVTLSDSATYDYVAGLFSTVADGIRCSDSASTGIRYDGNITVVFGSKEPSVLFT